MLFLQKKLFCSSAVAQGDPFRAQASLPIFFFRTTGLQHKLLILIESPNKFHLNLQNNNNNNKNKNKVGVVLGQITSNVNKKAKKLTLSIAFFHILHTEYI